MQKIQINGVDIEINVPSQEELILLKGQLESAKKVISDLKTANNHLVSDICSADQKIQALRAQQNHLKKDMEGTVAAYEDMKETAKENQTACQVLRGKLDGANREIAILKNAVTYWANQYDTADKKLQEIKKVLK